METIRVKDRDFAPFIDSPVIQEAVERVAAEIERDYKDKCPLFLVLLNGAFIFAADLLRCFRHPCNISFIKVASYSGTSSTQDVKVLIGLNEDLKGRHVVILEDIIDTGITMENILGQLAAQNPAEIRIATLLFKKDAFLKDFPIDYIGIQIPTDFIVGYGLDYDGFGRNQPHIYKITASKL